MKKENKDEKIRGIGGNRVNNNKIINQGSTSEC